MNIETADRLIALRKRKGLSQEELAELLGISRQAISKWERAESGPDVDNAILLSRLYNISLDELFGNKPEYEIELDRMAPDAPAEAEEEPEEQAATSEEAPEHHEEPSDESGEETGRSAKGRFGMDFSGFGGDFDAMDGVFRRAESFADDITKEAASLSDEAARQARETAMEAARQARFAAREQAYNNEEAPIPADAETIRDASYEGIRRLVCAARANLYITHAEGDLCTVACKGPEKEKDRCFVYTVGDTLHIEMGNEKRRFFFGAAGRVKLDISVSLPDALGVEANLKGGDLTIEGIVTDSLMAKTGGGDIKVAGCSAGEMSLKTGGGDVTVENSQAQRAEIVCGGGDVEADGLETAALLTVRTGGGDVTLSGSARCIETVTGGGDIELQVNAEGIKAKSGGGDIDLRCSGARNVNAKTGGGDIKAALYDCTGVTVDAASMGGESIVEYKGERTSSGRKLSLTLGDGSTMVEMRSGGGDVKLAVK